MKKECDIVYFEQYGGTISHGTITKVIIESDEGAMYYAYNILTAEGEESYIEEHNCLSETDPKVQKYLKKMNKGLWLARDIDGTLLCHTGRPEMSRGHWHSSYMMIVDPLWYPEVTFENSPKKLKL